MQTSFLNPLVAGKMLPTTPRCVARGDIWNEKTSFNPFFEQRRHNAEAILKNCEFVAYLLLRYFEKVCQK
jgi:hypothetical protein